MHEHHEGGGWTLNPTTQDCLVLAATIAAASVTSAGPVRFENTTGYEWRYSVLDLTLAAEDQIGGTRYDVTGSSLYLYFDESDFYPYRYSFEYELKGDGAELWISGRNRFANPFDAGQTIGPGMAGGEWDQRSTVTGLSAYYDYNGDHEWHREQIGLLPDGTPTYIGARLTIDNSLHYGWVGLTSTLGRIDVFAWGYETEAGVPVQAGVPTPGGLGVLALGAVGALSRKRRG